ncbi:uncharacterized protein LOC108737766 isoform X2 [Agrilus planipennis]|uniref:Uncharacterized protein LOC108737766 isoform X2 n=1 Tax=Agrilus planipennis TaxID=224129 RepID=A0A7F5RFI0_AGRPL|nr:uncharacterized protein LOC108737766 isoform X2 [Agrilus planipennis]
MLPKYPKPLGRKILIKSATALFVVEAITFAFSYGVWYKLNRERDFRLYMRNNFPKILEFYYTLDDKFGNTNIRLIDSDYWKRTSS